MSDVAPYPKLSRFMAVQAACVLEATARKPGNVHPQASFVDLTHAQLMSAAAAIAPVLARAVEKGVGTSVRDAVEATRAIGPGNPNLGIILLLAPLAAAPSDLPLKEGIRLVLAGLSRHDAELVYEAIRLAKPGGMGEVQEADVAHLPAIGLVDAMRLAAGRDLVAAQYADHFWLVLDHSLPILLEEHDFALHWERAIVSLHLRLLARFGDSLIARKCGVEVSAEAARRARAVLDAGWPHTTGSDSALEALDNWLRAEGHRRNPGTTADLVTATLFAALREGRVALPRIAPLRFAWDDGSGSV